MRLSEILSFHSAHFLENAPSLLDYVKRYRGAAIPVSYRIEFADYDWTVNRQP